MCGDGFELDAGMCLLAYSWVIAASVLFFPLLPSSGLRSRQKCMSQRYMVPAVVQAGGGLGPKGGHGEAVGV